MACKAVLSPTLSKSVFSMSPARRLEPYSESVLDHSRNASSPSKNISCRLYSACLGTWCGGGGGGGGGGSKWGVTEIYESERREKRRM